MAYFPALNQLLLFLFSVLLPASALQEILKIDSARGAFSSDSPLVFELSNPATYKSTYAGTSN